MLMVVDQGKVLGMATNADLRRAMLQEKTEMVIALVE